METLIYTQLSVPEIRQIFRQELETYFSINKQKSDPTQQTDQWFDLDKFCQYHPDNPSKATIYPKLSNGEIPGHKKGKKWYFLKSEIDNYLKAGRRKTVAEIADEADRFLETKKKRS